MSEFENLLAVRLKAFSKQNPDNEVARLINESRQARILNIGKNLEVVGKAWMNRRIRGITWGKSYDELREDWRLTEVELVVEDPETRIQLLEKLASGLGLLARNLDKDQIKYSASILHPINNDPARVLIRALPDVSISSSSIIFIKCLVDLWNDQNRTDRLRDYMADSSQRDKLTNSRNGDIQIGGTVDVVNSFYDFEKSLPE